MPICRKCSVSFKNRIKIGGIVRVLNRRKYCLDCSPFKGHNTQKLHKWGVKQYDGKQKPIACIRCRRQYLFNKKQGHTLQYCNSCRTKIQHEKTRDKALKYKGGKCQICGYYRCKRAIHFHHINPETKKYTISVMINQKMSWLEITEELEKTIAVCANCHGEIHDGLWPQYLISLDNATVGNKLYGGYYLG
jgi:hypothetical protein